MTETGNQLELISDAGALFLQNNWLKPGYVNSFAGGYTGTVQGSETSLTGHHPGFIDFDRQNFRLERAAPVIDAGSSLDPVATAHHLPLHEYRKHQQGEFRRPLGPPDLGAFEFSPFSAWRAEHFGADAENDLVSGADADPDGDGVVNLLEFAFALNPHAASRTSLPRGVLWDVAGNSHFAVEFARPPQPTGLVYLTRVTDDFQQWSPGCEYADFSAPTATDHTTDASDADRTRVRLNEPLAARKFRAIQVRVRIE